jgi:cyclopropane-fatty-acyl-phospholipid synthase
LTETMVAGRCSDRSKVHSLKDFPPAPVKASSAARSSTASARGSDRRSSPRPRLAGLEGLRPLQRPPEEARLRRRRHSRKRDAAAIAHHYDVSNPFYRLVLGPR